MIHDPIETAKLVTREIRTTERNGERVRVAVARRTYPTDRGDLWDCLTNAERIPRWFLPVSGDLRLDEKIVGHILVEGLNDPVAITESIRPVVAVSGDIEPVSPPPLPIVRAAEQTVHDLCKGVRR